MMDMAPINITLENGKRDTYFEEKGKISFAEMSMKVTDHRCLSFFIGLDFDCGGQGFGGNMLGNQDDYDKPHCVDLRQRINRLFDVSDWSQLKNKTAYAIRKTNSWNSNIVGLKNEKGYMFFIEHWRRDHFSEVEGYKPDILPIRYEVPAFSPNCNRLEGIE